MILAIETSCDDSAVALLNEAGQPVYEAISSQAGLHAKYGGVVPEMASRQHLATLPLMLDQLKQEVGLNPDQIKAIAVTQAPGLIGSVLVGLNYAKSLAWAWDKPLVPVDHLEGHLLAPFLDHPDFKFPFLSLIASGGHTHLILAKGLGDYHLLGKTLDDALGEAFDKTAKLLGLSYPGGPILDRIAQGSVRADIEFPLPLQKSKTLDFSFSGIKTAVKNQAIARQLRVENSELVGYAGFEAWDSRRKEEVGNLVASFQNCAVRIVCQRFSQALERVSVSQISLTGGVAANSALAGGLAALAKEKGLGFFRPSLKHCTDNAAMIGLVAQLYLKQGLGVAPDPRGLRASPKSAIGLMELSPDFAF
ncbi:MAG: tRNA (adenosine(37)-N6)-threonylcarbamoyltransferase complex transferase subunit TsaD [Candidatus Lambdaproteobacteria bacterium RIFOXYD2_FULL_50_16]|uniref:tRNA N6-adenosine threonylcarbamoyltransferase n=1 Tax=Candidatus Lambdaproteobacteria bacterium RIFOXYD2_FULL_50_16 TaxID=1817772 RepID=A0A1F6G9F2_9PROT|nr:MAG: tRNA (adenosine(37)-N6)-threonylcarbamoyltransferase complex transferase subunit TsaD [Candidatus Lambdaproteobacteria bacterium RIFOXYD2_FULL_50_16]